MINLKTLWCPSCRAVFVQERKNQTFCNECGNEYDIEQDILNRKFKDENGS